MKNTLRFPLTQLGALAFALAPCAPIALPAEGLPARHVVVVVWDGMRPDFISAETTPNLWRLEAGGVSFAHHHPVYPSATEVNGVAIATGDYPEHSFVVANVDFRPRIDPQNAIGIEVPAAIRRGDAASGNRYLGVATVAEILHARGWRTAIAGAKQVALLHDRSLRPDTAGASPVVFEGDALPPRLKPLLLEALGGFPPISDDGGKMARDAWTTRALLEVLWKDGVPPFSLLWLSEPDYSQHRAGVASARALAAIRSSDANLGKVLGALEARGLREDTDVFVVSDHGFSTITRVVDVAVELSKAGFQSMRAAMGGLGKGQVLVVSNVGTSLFYVGGRDPGVSRRLAAWLQLQDWVGVVFSRDGAEGTFPLSEARIDSPEAPDLLVSMRWAPGRNAAGVPGLLTSDLAPADRRAASHASLSPYEMHNTLVAAGPDFRKGVVDTLPTGNTDLAPTIFWLLGLKEEAVKRDGRVLGEALAVEAPPLRSYEIKRLTSARQAGEGAWSQYLQVSEVNGVRYIDEGNGKFTQGPGRR